jgi:WD40 repeat protein
LPELASAGTSAKEIADLFRGNNAGSEILLRQAFAQASAIAKAAENQKLQESIRQYESENREEDARVLREKLADATMPAVRLAVLADQLEELFTSGIPDDVISLFIDRLASLATNGRIFILGTLRSDFYPRCLEHPQLVELMRDRGTYALPAPTATDLGQMIRQPAAAAGLVFEESPTGEKLDELLRDAAIKDPAALPLLSYTLEQLYERRTEHGLLTLDAYRDLGGLEGAIGRRAEDVFNNLPDEAKSAFDQVWRQLITLSENSQPVRRRTNLAAFSSSPGASRLVEGLVSARLLTVDQTAAGESSVSVAHEALLKHWPRLVSWVNDNIDFLRARSRMATRLAEWLDHNSSDDYLISAGPPLAEAEGILAKHAPALDGTEIDFVRRSSARARRHEQARLRRARSVAAGALLLSALAIAGGFFAWTQSNVAKKERSVAVTQKLAAENSANAALTSQIRSSYLLGIEKLEAGKSREGLTYLANTLRIDPTHTGARDRLYSYHLYGLPKAIPLRSVASPDGIRQRISGAKKGPEQKVIYLTSKASEIFDLNTRQVIHGGWEDEPDCFASVMGPDSKNIVYVRKDLTTSIWNLATGKKGADLPISKDFCQIIGNSDGELVIDCQPDGTVRVRRSSDGKSVYSWTQKSAAYWSAETREGDFLISGHDELCYYNRNEGKVTARRTDPDFIFTEIRVAPSADIVAVFRISRNPDKPGSNIQFLHSKTLEPLPDSRSLGISEEVWDFQINETGTAIGIAQGNHAAKIHHRSDESKDRVFEFDSYPSKVCFTPDEKLFITATPDGTVRIFDADSTRLAFEPISHDGRLEDLGISWDGRYLLTATAKHARIWDLAVGPALTLPIVCPDGFHASNEGSAPGSFWIADKRGLQQWDLTKLEPVGAPVHHDDKVHDCLFNQTATHVALLWDSKNIRFARTDQPDSKELLNWQAPDTIKFWSYSKDGGTFSATVGADLHFVDAATAKPIGTPWKLPSTPIDSLFGNKDEWFVAILPPPNPLLNGQNEVKLWDIKNSKEVKIAQAEASLSMVRISNDGRWLAASGKSVNFITQAFAVLWDLHSPETPPRSIPHQDEIFDIKFSPDGNYIALGGKDHAVQVWDTVALKKSARPVFDPFGAINSMIFSPDSTMIATVAVESGKSLVRVWDWREGTPISQPFEFPTLAEDLLFSKDSRTLIFQRKADASSQKSLFNVIEISPPPDLGIDMVALAEGTMALRVSKDGISSVLDPFESWNLLRSKAPHSWFFQHPASRGVSPAIHAPSLRWIEEDAVTIDNLSEAMPAVGLARAATAYWDLTRYNRRLEAANKLPHDSEEYKKERATLYEMRRKIHSLVTFADRNAANDPQVSLYLSRYHRLSDQKAEAKTYIDQGLAASPDDPKLILEAFYVADLHDDAAAALKHLRRLRELQPDDINHRVRLGFNLWRTGKAADAKIEFVAAADHPAVAKEDRAPILGLLGRGEESLALYKELAEQTKDEKTKEYGTGGFVLLIMGYGYSGEIDEAISWYRKLIGQLPAAADQSVIELSTFSPEIKAGLLKVLTATLKKHPELAPEANTQ